MIIEAKPGMSLPAGKAEEMISLLQRLYISQKTQERQTPAARNFQIEKNHTSIAARG